MRGTEHARRGRGIALREYELWSRGHDEAEILGQDLMLSLIGLQSVRDLCIMTGERCARVPDEIEPGEHPDHRRLAHSTNIADKLRDRIRTEWRKTYEEMSLLDLVFRIGALAYVDHIEVDSQTRKGVKEYRTVSDFLLDYLVR